MDWGSVCKHHTSCGFRGPPQPLESLLEAPDYLPESFEIEVCLVI
jgi:hypothetical protein